MYHLRSYCYEQIPEKSNLQEERLILVHGFRGLYYWLFHPQALRQNIMMM